VTLGEEISGKIGELFDQREFALASILDSYASEGAELAADAVQRAVRDALSRSGRLEQSSRLLRYSPGYCGWHVSGQRALFAVLDPSRIGITLRESCLMQPLKSISGVIAVGLAEIHDFEDAYPFCAECETRGCRERIRQLGED
jgi:cobalamin-dependent methionine synthase I